MKKLTACALILILLALADVPAVRCEETEKAAAAYTAITYSEIRLRKEPRNGAHQSGKVPRYATVEVLEYGEKWSLIRYKQREGWGLTRYLWGFVALDPFSGPPPRFEPCKGYVILSQKTLIKGGKFTGLEAEPGTLVAVFGEDLTLPVWRGTGKLPADAGTYHPFADWQKAQQGDLIAGYTTYYNDRTGRPLHRERQHNIELAATRIMDTVVQPGGSFSFRDLTGPLTLANGYQKAQNISHSGVGPGGGVCQLSTTLYNALLYVPLRITEWAAHRESGVKYIRKGFDSAIGSRTDLCFENTLSYPVRITALTQSGALTVLISRAEGTE